MKKNIKNEKHEYFVNNGFVVGNLWGGGIGAYESRKYKADSLESLKTQILNDFESGALDSGAGFERLLAGYVIITDKKQVEIEKEQFFSIKDDIFTFGNTALLEKFNF